MAEIIGYIFLAHSTKAKKPSKAVRKWDGKTPYGVHPTWCAMTILSEPMLPEEIRLSGAEALLMHDLLEDTEAELWGETSQRVLELVEGMTFKSSEEEMKLVWERSQEIRLLKVYDKTSNLLDGSWMTSEKRVVYERYLSGLCDDVEKAYGKLNIIHIARSVILRYVA